MTDEDPNWGSTFRTMTTWRRKQEADIALAAWMTEKRAWQMNPERYEQIKAEEAGNAE